MKLNFYSGENCHLCELAEKMLAQLDPALGLEVRKFDVKVEHDLHHLYGARIPVFKRLDNNSELGWPFELDQLQEFLA